MNTRPSGAASIEEENNVTRVLQSAVDTLDIQHPVLIGIGPDGKLSVFRTAATEDYALFHMLKAAITPIVVAEAQKQGFNVESIGFSTKPPGAH